MLPLDQQRAAWEAKPCLRAVYEDYHRHILSSCRPGRILEVGSGSGALKERVPEAVALDIQKTPFVDLVADAQTMPFAAASFDSVVGIDVLHHLVAPLRFLEEASRVLRPAGRLVLLDPAITAASGPIYRIFHDEPVDMSVDPFAAAESGPLPANANQAVPTLLFGRYRDALAARVPALAVLEVRFLSLWAYPLSGGFRKWSLLPGIFVAPLLAIERRFAPVLGRYLGFRLLVIAERR